MGACDIVVPETVNTEQHPEISTFVEINNDIPEPKGRSRTEYRSEYADIACRLAAAYFNEQDIAYALGVSLSTIHNWKHKYPGFKAACEDGRREQKKRLVARAMKQAMGYTFTEYNNKQILDCDGSVLKTEVSEFHRENPGNERLLVFLLCNLDRQLGDEEWKSVSKVEVDESRHVKIVIDGKAAKEQIKRLSGELLEEVSA